MSYFTASDMHNLLMQEIRSRFPDTRIEFTEKLFPERPELWVYVFDKKRFPEIDKFCKTLEARRLEPPVPISILVKTWSGPWPGGESEDEIRKKRDAFRRQHLAGT